MKKASKITISSLLFAVASISLLVSSVNAPTAWVITDVDTSGDVYHCSMALDSSDNPHISYIQRIVSGNEWIDALRYARLTGTTWNTETVTTGDITGSLSIALDSSDNPHISYCNWSSIDLNYARWTGTAWSIETVDSAGSVGYSPSIALDSSDNPHISYLDLTNVLKYARWTGTTWNIAAVDSANSDMGCSLALDSSENPHISYFDDVNGDLMYARWTGTTWNIETVTTAGFIWGVSSSLALDSSENPHISYIDAQNGAYDCDLMYVRWTGTTWNTEFVDVTSSEPSLALDSNDNPHISYRDWTPGMPSLKYAERTGLTWSIETLAEMGCGSEDSSLAVDSNDNPHISFCGRVENGPNLRYATIQRQLIATGKGRMCAEGKYVSGPAELYMIGDTQVELEITEKGVKYSRLWGITDHYTKDDFEIFKCSDRDGYPLTVRINLATGYVMAYGLGARFYGKLVDVVV